MIASQFKEGLTKIVQLPENDHEDFGLVLRFLYKGDSGFYPIGEPGPALFEKLADLYIVAEKYDIRSLKECVIRGLGTISKEPMEYKTFFKITDKITHNTPETDTLFWDFFHDRARSVLGNGSTITEASSLMYAVVAEGGKFGEELWTVMNEVWLQKIGNLTTEKDAIKKKYESFRSVSNRCIWPCDCLMGADKSIETIGSTLEVNNKWGCWIACGEEIELLGGRVSLSKMNTELNSGLVHLLQYLSIKVSLYGGSIGPHKQRDDNIQNYFAIPYRSKATTTEYVLTVIWQRVFSLW